MEPQATERSRSRRARRGSALRACGRFRGLRLRLRAVRLPLLLSLRLMPTLTIPPLAWSMGREALDECCAVLSQRHLSAPRVPAVVRRTVFGAHLRWGR